MRITYKDEQKMKVKELLKNNVGKEYIVIAGRSILWEGFAEKILKSASNTLLNAEVDETEKWGSNKDALYVDDLNNEEVMEVFQSYAKGVLE